MYIRNDGEANTTPPNQSSDSDSDSDDDAAFSHPLGDPERSDSPRKKRRPSTTEALRRTSLEDDDEGDEVVHVSKEEKEDEELLCPIALDEMSGEVPEKGGLVSDGGDGKGR